MTRLTHERVSGIKSGYWSPNKKDELIARLAEYENTGLEPGEIKRRNMSAETGHWIAGCVCSKCGDARGPKNAAQQMHYHFCPVCGTPMDAGNEYTAACELLRESEDD